MDYTEQYLIKFFRACDDHPHHDIYIYYLDTPDSYIFETHSMERVQSIINKPNFKVVMVHINYTFR